MSYFQKKVSILKTLFISSVLCGGISYSLSYWVNPIWKAEAEITHPVISDLGNYYSLFSMYYFIKGENEADNSVERFVYQKFIEQLTSYDNLKRFWLNSEYYKQKIIGDEREDRELLNKLVKTIHFKTINDKTGGVSIISDNPKQADELLSLFINDTNLVTKTVMYEELIIKWKNLFNQVKTAAQLNLGRIRQGDIIDSQDWQGKLNMMKSVSPLDEHFTAFHFIKSPQKIEVKARKSWGWIGSGVGFFIGLFGIAFFRRRKEQV
ncbi:hypothetical protein [Rodentibacter caecimuris]|uniref:LPS chain length-determining protein n=1 Tax=Rodentibacter caecimuris TaxID=1796644 RepID=A0ABX3KUX7_9PAST|nr:hypothetical protein BKG89_10410 [Rodentibacter heylii]